MPERPLCLCVARHGVPGVENVAAQPADPAPLDRSAADAKDKGAKLTTCRCSGGQTDSGKPAAGIARVLLGAISAPFVKHSRVSRRFSRGAARWEACALLVNPPVRA